MCDHMFVITGGPGSGKTSLINALNRRGYRSMPEAGRAIIQDQIKIGGTSLPWANRLMFAELMLGWELRSWYEAMVLDGPVLMDRGIPDVIGYLTLCGLPVPDHAETAASLYSYNKRVFLAPYWDTIFAQDAERKQDRQEAEATGFAMAEVYMWLGYELIELPLTGLEERADFMVECLKAT